MWLICAGPANNVHGKDVLNVLNGTEHYMSLCCSFPSGGRFFLFVFWKINPFLKVYLPVQQCHLFFLYL